MKRCLWRWRPGLLAAAAAGLGGACMSSFCFLCCSFYPIIFFLFPSVSFTFNQYRCLFEGGSLHLLYVTPFPVRHALSLRFSVNLVSSLSFQLDTIYWSPGIVLLHHTSVGNISDDPQWQCIIATTKCNHQTNQQQVSIDHWASKDIFLCAYNDPIRWSCSHSGRGPVIGSSLRELILRFKPPQLMLASGVWSDCACGGATLLLLVTWPPW